MNEVHFNFAKLNESDEIMSFISNHWNDQHIFTKSKKLFVKEFLWLGRPEELTIALAKDESNHIIGIFCFKFFSYGETQDLTGSIWKVTSDAENQHHMIGYRLRQFVIDNIPHRFFSAPGPTLETKSTYKMLRYQWNQMKQYYLINPLLDNYQLIKCPKQNIKLLTNRNKSNILLKKIQNIKELNDFNFNRFSDILPFKDQKYLENRFFDYPFFKYDVFLVYKENEKNAENIIVCRKAIAKEKNGNHIASAYRIIDYYGEEDLLPDIIFKLFQKVQSQGDEFLDFVCHGFDDSLLKQAGMKELDFDNIETIIPNWFEPLVKKNISVFCVADKTNYTYRQCKADGDQDRPSMKA
jgi:hypothetical protein